MGVILESLDDIAEVVARRHYLFKPFI